MYGAAGGRKLVYFGKAQCSLLTWPGSRSDFAARGTENPPLQVQVRFGFFFGAHLSAAAAMRVRQNESTHAQGHVIVPLPQLHPHTGNPETFGEDTQDFLFCRMQNA